MGHPLGFSDISSTRRFLERVRYVVLYVREQVRIAVGDVRRLVSHASGDGHSRESHVDQGGHVRVAKVVYADAREPQLVASDIQRVPQLAGAHVREDALIVRRLTDVADVIAHLVAEELWHHHLPFALRRLGITYDVLLLDAPVGVAHVDLAAVEVDVVRRESQKLSEADTRPIEDLDGNECLVVGDPLAEGEVLAA